MDNVSLLPLNEKMLKGLEYQNFKAGVFDSIKSSPKCSILKYFKKGVSQGTLFSRVFSSPLDREKLYHFFEMTNILEEGLKKEGDFDFFTNGWSEIIFKIVELTVDIVRYNPMLFLKDTYLFDTAKISYGFFKIEDFFSLDAEERKERLFLVLNEKKEILSVSKHSFYTNDVTGVTSSYFHDCLDALSLKEDIERLKPSIVNEKGVFFMKDIMSLLFKEIKEGGSTISSIDRVNFFKKQEDYLVDELFSYFSASEEIVKKRSFNRARKEIDYNRLNQRTFPHFFSYFANIYFLPCFKSVVLPKDSTLSTVFFSELRRLKISSNHFRPSCNKYSFLEILKSYERYTLSILPLSQDKEKEQYLSSVGYSGLYYMNVDEYRGQVKHLLKCKSFSFSMRSLNTRKYANKTKFIMKNKKLDFLAIAYNLFILGYDTSFNPMKYFYDAYEIFSSLGVSEKKLRVFLFRYFSLETYIVKGEKGHIFLDSNILHDVFSTFFPQLLDIAREIYRRDIGSPKLISSVIGDFTRHQITSSGCKKILETLQEVDFHALDIKKCPDAPVGLKGLSKLIVLAKEERDNDKYAFIEKELGVLRSDASFAVSSLMSCHSRQLSLLVNIATNPVAKKHFQESSSVSPVSLEGERFCVSILPHNDTIGLLGGNVNGICISGDGEERVSHVYPAFLNLCVSDNEGRIMLWGLLCKSHDINGNDYYILNNLQGGINDKRISSKSVAKLIVEAFIVLLGRGRAKNIFFRNHAFNAMHLEGRSSISVEDFSSLKVKISVPYEVRLDFSYDNKGFIRGSFQTVA